MFAKSENSPQTLDSSQHSLLNFVIPSKKQKKNTAEEAHSSNLASAMLENEWLSFEQMIAPGGVTGGLDNVKRSSYLVDGVVAYPGMMKPSSAGVGNIAPVVQSSETSSSEDEGDNKDPHVPETDQTKSAVDDDDAFFLMRKQIKARDHSSSDGSSDSSSTSSSRSASPEKGSPSPPHLSPVNSVKSHESEPPNLFHAESGESVVKKQEEKETVVEEKDKKSSEHSKPVENTSSSDHKSSKPRERKRSHRDRSRSRHREHGSSRSKKHRSRSRSKDRKRRHGSRDRHRHKEKKRHSSRDHRRSKSRDRKRSRSKERKNSRSENGDKRRSRSRDRKDRKKDQKQSSSHNRHRSRSRDRRRDRSKDRRRKDRRSRSRSKRKSSRSRSRERLRSRSPVLGRKLTFKEQMRKEILTAGKEISQDKVEVEMPVKRPGEPLKPSDLLKGIKISSGESVTPQMALMQTMAAMHKKAQELTGVEVPKYYNPAAVNPLKYAEQVQKRKLLWSKKDDNKQKEKDEQIETQWKSAFIAEEDGKTASKFRKLMGMKAGEGEGPSGGEELSKLSEEQRRKHAELFQRLDQEYAFARMTTHTQRGVGLGFSSQVYDPNHPTNPPP